MLAKPMRMDGRVVKALGATSQWTNKSVRVRFPLHAIIFGGFFQLKIEIFKVPCVNERGEKIKYTAKALYLGALAFGDQ